MDGIETSGSSRIGRREKEKGQGRGNRRGGGGAGTQSREVAISKALSWILRHGAEKEGIKLDEQGFANLKDIVRGSHFEWWK
jgi:RNA:NAD 2'-phosphotransferase (TPT1/KptA family)